MKRKQVRNLVVALGLTAALGGGATLALLTAQTGAVTNTFTVGKNLQASDLLLNEADLQDDNRTADPDKDRVTELGFENLMQGDVMDKDPTVQIKPDAAECYMFIHVKGLDTLNDKGITTKTGESAGLNTSWVRISGEDGKLDGYYYYAGTGTTNNVLNPASSALKDDKGHANKNDGKGFMDLDPLFTQVVVADNAKIYDGVAELGKIEVTACAVQAQNVADVDAAFALKATGF